MGTSDFCTEWPSALDSDEKCLQHFPIEIGTSDYVSAGPSLRNPKARVVTLKVSEAGWVAGRIRFPKMNSAALIARRIKRDSVNHVWGKIQNEYFGKTENVLEKRLI